MIETEIVNTYSSHVMLDSIILDLNSSCFWRLNNLGRFFFFFQLMLDAFCQNDDKSGPGKVAHILTVVFKWLTHFRVSVSVQLYQVLPSFFFFLLLLLLLIQSTSFMVQEKIHPFTLALLLNLKSHGLFKCVHKHNWSFVEVVSLCVELSIVFQFWRTVYCFLNVKGWRLSIWRRELLSNAFNGSQRAKMKKEYSLNVPAITFIR